MDKIIIKREYFDNIKTTIDSLNDYFSSDFKKRNFPSIDDDSELDGTILTILSWLNNVEPEWIIDSSKLNETLDDIIDQTEGINGPDVLGKIPDSVADKVYAVIGCRALEMITTNFESFSNLLNGIYTFEIFTTPSKYSNDIDVFSQPLQLYELNSILHDDIEISLFDVEKYVTGVFNNDQITLPSSMNQYDETERMKKKANLKDVEIVVEETTQEAAEINYFENSHTANIKYSNGKWEISNQFKMKINSLISKLKSCDDIRELRDLFNSPSHPSPDDFSSTVIPFILAKVFNNPKKFPFDKFNKKSLGKYVDSYTSIVDKNNGAKRFQNYDMFSTFKADKESTIDFIENFLNLNLVNDDKCSIKNNTLLTVFNIFDSHIYLNILYNEMPPVEKRKISLDQFIKTTRARINKNSRQVMQYKEDTVDVNSDNKVNTSDKITEYCSMLTKSFGDMNAEDILYCEAYQDIMKDEISVLGDTIYNMGMSQIDLDKFITEACITEQENGSVPDYIEERIKTSDQLGTTQTPTTTDVNLPPDVPANSISQLADSIDGRMDNTNPDGLEGMLGNGYNGPHAPNENSHVVYNITYTNSFNRDSNNTNTNTNTSNDTSTGKTVSTNTNYTNSYNGNTNNHDSSHYKQSTRDAHNVTTTTRDSHHTTNRGVNNYNNSTGFEDTTAEMNDYKLSNGLTVGEMFNILEAAEPLSDETDAGKLPKGDSLTRAMDRDRKLLKHQQNAKRKIQKGANTTRAVLKPISRTKQWLTKLVDSLIKRDENKVKAEIIESKNYRTALYKGCRIGLKLGLVAVSTAISGYLTAALIAGEGLRIADRNRLKKEVQDEFLVEIQIIDDKIKKTDEAGDLKQKYELMRMRNKMASIAGESTTGSKIVTREIIA